MALLGYRMAFIAVFRGAMLVVCRLRHTRALVVIIFSPCTVVHEPPNNRGLEMGWQLPARSEQTEGPCPGYPIATRGLRILIVSKVDPMVPFSIA